MEMKRVAIMKMKVNVITMKMTDDGLYDLSRPYDSVWERVS